MTLWDRTLGGVKHSAKYKDCLYKIAVSITGTYREVQTLYYHVCESYTTLKPTSLTSNSAPSSTSPADRVGPKFAIQIFKKLPFLFYTPYWLHVHLLEVHIYPCKTNTGDWTSGVRFPTGEEIFFSLPWRPDRLWGPSNLLSKVDRKLFSRRQSDRNVTLTTHLHLLQRLWMRGAVPALSQTSWHCA